MARRKRTSTADALMELGAMPPWWAGVLLAMVCCFVLHNIASQPVVAPTQPGQQDQASLHRSTAWSATAPVPQKKAASDQAPWCPPCAKPMVHRTAQRGANARGDFWGCTAYPVCRGTRPIA